MQGCLYEPALTATRRPRKATNGHGVLVGIPDGCLRASSTCPFRVPLAERDCVNAFPHDKRPRDGCKETNQMKGTIKYPLKNHDEPQSPLRVTTSDEGSHLILPNRNTEIRQSAHDHGRNNTAKSLSRLKISRANFNLQL